METRDSNTTKNALSDHSFEHIIAGNLFSNQEVVEIHAHAPHR
jgi:hypothetical protein